MKITKKIMQIVAEKEKEQVKLERCLTVCICPWCGSRLDCDRDKPNKTKKYTCISHTCNFEHLLYY